jgi:hypothetical protein
MGMLLFQKRCRIGCVFHHQFSLKPETAMCCEFRAQAKARHFQEPSKAKFPAGGCNSVTFLMIVPIRLAKPSDLPVFPFVPACLRACVPIWLNKSVCLYIGDGA